MDLPLLLILTCGAIQDPPAVALTTSELPGGVAGVAYSATLVATGGTAPYSWSLSGTPPDGIKLDETTGALTGTPGRHGTFKLIVAVRDRAGSTDSRAFVIHVARKDFFSWLHDDCGLTLRERADVADDGAGSGPAKLEFSRSKGQERDYSLDAALIWTMPLLSDSAFRINGLASSIDAHIGSDPAGERSVAIRAGATGFWHLDPPKGQPHLYFQVNLLHESDQKFDEQTLGPEIKISPTLSSLMCGSTGVLIGPDVLSFYWRPWFGVSANIPFRERPGEDADTIYRFFATGRFVIQFPSASDELRLESISLFAELRGNLQASRGDLDDKSHGYVQTGILAALTPNASIEGGYKKGELPPRFSEVIRQWYVALAVSF